MVLSPGEGEGSRRTWRRKGVLNSGEGQGSTKTSRGRGRYKDMESEIRAGSN